MHPRRDDPSARTPVMRREAESIVTTHYRSQAQAGHQKARDFVGVSGRLSGICSVVWTRDTWKFIAVTHVELHEDTASGSSVCVKSGPRFEVRASRHGTFFRGIQNPCNSSSSCWSRQETRVPAYRHLVVARASVSRDV